MSFAHRNGLTKGQHTFPRAFPCYAHIDLRSSAWRENELWLMPELGSGSECPKEGLKSTESKARAGLKQLQVMFANHQTEADPQARKIKAC